MTYTRKDKIMGINFEEDKQDLVEKTDINALSVQVDKLLDIEKQIETSEEHTKNLKTIYDKISSEIIPNVLAEQGLKSLKLADGTVLEVNKKYSCTIPKDPAKKEAAYKWLREQGLGDLIKNEVAVTFGRGEDNKADELLSLAASKGFEPQQKSKVEPMTLKALYRERVEAGLDMPSDLFHLFVKDETKLSRK
ncbi:MAG: gp33 family protein [Promethearchaeota archaeon]